MEYREELTLNVVQGIGDIFWVYQKFSKHVHRINFNIVVTVPSNHPAYAIQHRAIPFLKLLPKVGEVKIVTDQHSRWAAAMQGYFPMKDILKQDIADYACNYKLEQGVRIEDIDPAYAIEECVPLPEEPASVPNSGYLAIYASRTTMLENALEFGVWDVEHWVQLIRLINEKRLLPLPIVMFGANYDREALENIRKRIESEGIKVHDFYIDLPAKQVINLLRRATFFIGHQSGLNILADNLGTSQLMLYMKPFEKMMYTWCRRDDHNRFNAALFSQTPSDIVESLERKLTARGNY